MLTSTFQHLTGVGPSLEERFWREGYMTWDAALTAVELPCRRHEYTRIREQLKESCLRFAQGDARWFGSRLDCAEQWRLYGAFKGSCACLDIETTGLSRSGDAVTAVCLWDGKTIRTFVQGKNLEEFSEALEPYSLLVTFNGRSFDVPFLERNLNMRIDMAHLDLRWAFRPLGFTGGLKRIERALGRRRPGLEGVDGHTAVLLWAEYERSGNPEALETLLAYNVEDTIILEPLAIFVYNAYIQGLSLPLEPLPMPAAPANPFRPSTRLLRKLGIY